MIMEIYAVRDKQVNAYLQPFFSPSVGSALRSLRTVVGDPNHDFHKHVNDFTLHRLGSFDDATGVLSAESNGPVVITELAGLTDKSPSA